MKIHSLKEVTDFDFDLTQLAKKIFKSSFSTATNFENNFMIFEVKVKVSKDTKKRLDN